jgi:hypothetical protein
MVQGYDYSSYVTALATLAVVDPANSDFQELLPSIIDYAELRIYQDLDLLSTVSPQTGFSLSTGTRTLVLPIETFITLQDVNVLTPVGTSDPNAGTRNPCLPVSKEFLDMVYGSVAGAALPSFFAMVNQNTLAFGPWPDQAYALEIVGTVRPESLSMSNMNTFIATYLPSLFMMASMVYVTAYQRNWSATSDDPQMAVNYEQQYKALLASAGGEELRKKYSSTGWTSMSPSPAATPARN